MQHASHRQQTTVKNTVLSVSANMECRSPFYTVCEEEAKEGILNVVVYSSVYSKFIYICSNALSGLGPSNLCVGIPPTSVK